MSSERWQRIEEIFERALERPADERAAFLDEACDGDASVRRAVESLLEADRKGADFLEQPLPSSTEGSSGLPVPLPGDGRVGPYRLLYGIGQGGMSTVFLAVRDDETFQRRVAVKIIRRGMESEDALRRLRTERQILAGLEHPYVARLYDGGTTAEGLPYFVMEYVEGVPIDAYCDHHQLSVGERIELFRKVCEAVYHAHKNLVVHRDLKPSNILVRPDGVPKLLDFGIAKLLNPELSSAIEPTAAWLRVLTPSYASPEQIRGEPLTTASDVYSLGVLLYQLLTGRLPHRLEGRTPQEVERLLETEPPRPSDAVRRPADGTDATETATPDLEEIARARGSRPEALARHLAGDLDDIVLMAMHSVPGRRYGSVEQLSEDLRRHAMGFPVAARHSDYGYRLGKFLRRNWGAVAGLAGVVAVVFAFAVATALQSARVARERDEVRRERDQKQQVLALVEDVFQLADPSEARGETFTVREALDRSAARLDRRLGNQPAVEASLRNTVGRIYFNLGLLADAEDQIAEALELERRIYGEESLEVSESLSALGAVYREKGEYRRAEELISDAIARTRRQVGDDHPALIRPLNDLVTLRCYEGDHEAADEPSSLALALAREHLDESAPETAVAVTNRAVVVRKKGDLEQAERLYHEGLELQRALLGEDHPEIANVLNNLAVVLKERGEFERAEELHRQTLALRRRLYGASHPTVAQSLTNLAAAARDRGDHARAEAHYREAVDVLRGTLGASHPMTLKVAVTYAHALLESGQAAAAEAWLRDHLEIWRAQPPQDEGLLSWAENALGEALTELGRYPEAEALLEPTLARLEELYGEDHSRTARARERLAALYEAWKRPETASSSSSL